MAVVLEVLASYIQNMLTEMATQEVHMLLGVSSEIDKMGDKLGGLKNFIADADKRNITDQSVQAWVKELRGAMYDATDIVDLCHLRATERDARCFNPLLFCLRNPLHAHDIGSRIKKLNKRLDSIKRCRMDFGFNLSSYEECSGQVASSRLASRETSAELDESDVVGEKIDEDTRYMVQMLTEGKTNQDENKIMVFAIVGVGGIGKTTLAQKIMNNDVIEQEFTKKMWLSVNEEFSDTELLRRAITEAGGDHQTAGNTKGALERTLKDTLNGCKTFLVMDDVWNHWAWVNVLKTPLIKAVARGSRVLVTTRHNTVAREMKAVEPYHHVNKLEPEDAWSLLKKQVVGIGNDEPHIEMLKDIGMKIIANCDYLPLAVKAIGGLLRQKKTRRIEWENVLNDSIRSVSQLPEELNYAIYLSYQDLQPSLKPCFLHYSLLPKSILFNVDKIVGMWISEGFVHGNSRDLEELGREYYDELIGRNLLEPNRNYMDQRVCSMHDVVRSFAQYKARDEALVVHHSKSNITGNHNSKMFIRLSLETEGSESSELEWSSLREHVSLRTLVLAGHIKIKPGDSLVSFSCLRTLHIQYAEFDALVESLSQLKHLRYLSIEYTNTSRLPENIGNMKFLQYISLLGCISLVKLPCSIGKLQQLRFLQLDKTRINTIPRGFDCLTNLRKLYGFPVRMDRDRCSLEELGPLSRLTLLTICDLENVSSSSFARKARLYEKARLNILALMCTSKLGDKEGVSDEEQERIEKVFDELCPPPCLENLVVNGYFGRRMPRWMTTAGMAENHVISLRILTMDELLYCTELPDCLCQLPWLEELQIVRTRAIKHVGSKFLQPYNHCHNRFQVAASFPSLRSLTMGEMLEWEEWEWEEHVQAMPILESFLLKCCKLRCVPPGLAIHGRSLRKLTVYEVEHLSYLENYASIVDLDVRGNPDLERISNIPKLQMLTILHCPKMKLLDDVPALRTLRLVDYEMGTVPKYLQGVSPRHLLLDCSLWLLTSIAAGKSGPEWDKFSHIQQVKAYADDDDNNIKRKWYVLYTRDPFRFETNISRSATLQARGKRKRFAYLTTCPIEDEWPTGSACGDSCEILRDYFRGWKGGVERAYWDEPGNTLQLKKYEATVYYPSECGRFNIATTKLNEKSVM